MTEVLWRGINLNYTGEKRTLSRRLFFLQYKFEPSPMRRHGPLQTLTQNLLHQVFYPDREAGAVFLFVSKVIQCDRPIVFEY